MLTVQLPLNIVSVANLRESWQAKSRRTRMQREAAHYQLRALMADPPLPPVIVTLTRIGPRPLDDDNLASAFKAVRDGVADWLGQDDGSPLITWVYRQERGAPKTYAARIEVRL